MSEAPEPTFLEKLRKARKPAPQSTGETHYSDRAIQPIEFTEANKLGFHEGNIIKYITRWRHKDGVKDLEKAKWYVERLIELETQNRVRFCSQCGAMQGAIQTQCHVCGHEAPICPFCGTFMPEGDDAEAAKARLLSGMRCHE